jgi:hypothetical protein
MSKESARQELLELGQAINTAVVLLRPHMDLIARYEKERRDMDNFGSIVNPTLFNNSERRAVDAIMAPLYAKARELVETYEIQMATAATALAKVKR